MPLYVEMVCFFHRDQYNCVTDMMNNATVSHILNEILVPPSG